MPKGKITMRRIATILSIIYLVALTILAAYASHSSHAYSLPISNTLSTFTLLLPPIAGIVLETSNALATSISSSSKTLPVLQRSSSRSTIPPVLLPSTLAIVALLIYTTVIATLAGTHIAPSTSLDCALHERWQALFSAKDGDSIRAIQDAFTCCGLRSGRDMAFPFPSNGAERHTGADACLVRYEEREGRSCLEPWRREERLVSGLMMGVAVGVFVWMVIIVATPALHPPSIRSILHLPPAAATSQQSREGNRTIEYAPYRDDPEATASDNTQPRRRPDENEDDDTLEEDDTSVRREINALNSQSNLASLVEGGRVHPSGLNQERWMERRLT